jgi:hypothetical protein
MFTFGKYVLFCMLHTKKYLLLIFNYLPVNKDEK